MYEEYFNFLNIDYQKRIALIKYASLVIDYNKNINITGAKNIEDFIKEHIVDSLLAFDLFKNYDNIIDIGSGAGLPSIPLSIIYDNKKFVLCESKNKKADFLKLAKKEICLNNIEIKTICPLHGPILKENIAYYIDKYNTWSSYTPEDEGILIAYASIHGNTANVAKELAAILTKKGVKNVVLRDLVNDDMSEAVEDAFRYDKMVLAASSYNAEVFPPMEHFLNHLKGKNFQKRKIGIIENGTWAPSAAKSMLDIINKMKDINLCNNIITIKSTLKESDLQLLDNMANELINC